MKGNVITANFRNGQFVHTDPLWQYDYGQVLRFTGVSLPETFEVHFSNAKEFGQAKTAIGTADGVLIPDEYLISGKPVFAWIFLHVGEDDGETVYMAQIPVNKRSVPSDEAPTPQEQSAITQAIAALNSAVVDVQEAVDAADSARASATSAASSATAAAASEAGVEADADRASNAATAAESAQVAAEAAQSGAETAQTGAESARDEAAQASVAQIAQINATGAAVLESIPADYTELSEDVGNLKSDIIEIQNVTNENLLNNVSWEVGSINKSDGLNTSGTTRIRTVGFIDLQTVNTLIFNIASGYKYVVDWYNSDKTLNKSTPQGTWQTDDMSIIVPDNAAYMRLLIATISDDEANIAFAQYLSVEGTNNFIDAVNKINGMENEIDNKYINPLDTKISCLTDYNPPFKYMDIELEMGGYDADGENVEDDSGIRWRTPEYIYVSDMLDTSIVVPTGFNMYVCLYNEWNVFKSRSTWTSGSTHNVAGNYSIRWAITKATWVPSTQGEANCVFIKEKIKWYEYLSNGANPLSEYPDYFEQQLKTTASNFINDMLSVGANGDGFVFLTDIHWNGNYKHTPNLLYYLKENTNLNMVICGGDLIDRSTSNKESQIKDMQMCIKAFRDVGVPFLTAIGNHERNSSGVYDSSLYLSENEVFSITQNPINFMPLNYADMNRICYYYDKVSTKTRYIFIDSGQNNIATYDITTDEISWVTSVINATDLDWHIIIIVHQLGTYNLSNPISESNPFVYTQGAQDMLDVLDSLVLTHNIEAIFTGHTHYDNHVITTGGIPIIWTDSDARWQYYGMSAPLDGTVDAQCFDVVTMDYANKKIYLRRVGRGSDRTISY